MSVAPSEWARKPSDEDEDPELVLPPGPFAITDMPVRRPPPPPPGPLSRTVAPPTPEES